MDGDNASLSFKSARGTRTRAALGVVNGEPTLGFTDARGTLRADFGVLKDAPFLTLSDARENTRASLTVLNGNPWLMLQGAEGKPCARLAIRDGAPLLRLEDANGFASTVGVTETEIAKTGESRKTSAASLVMFGKDGSVIWRAP